MCEIEFHREAEEEVKEAAAYYEEQVLGLGDEFLDQIDHALDQVQRFPLLGTPYEDDYRRRLLRRFPYGVVYRVEEDRIYVLAVPHLHWKPGYWKERKYPRPWPRRNSVLHVPTFWLAWP